MSTLHAVELGVLGPLQVRRDGAPVTIPGAKPRAILTMLGLHGGSVLSAETLLELLWGDDPPRTAAKALQTHISSLRRTLGDGFVLTQGSGWILNTSETDASRYRLATQMGRDAAAAGETSQAVARFEEALTLWRGTPELPDTRRGTSEKTRWIEGHAALIEDRADALLATGRAAEIIGELEAAVAEAPLRERRWGQLMLALYRAGRQGEALAAYQRARSLLVAELGVDPGPELRRLETAIVAQDAALDIPVAQDLPTVTRAVTFLLTDIEGSTAAWEADADAMAVALARHDELVEQVVTSRGGRLIKTRGEGDATFSVFDRPSAAAAAAMELQDAIVHEPWELLEPMRIRIALHTGEVELRDGDYFGRAVNRAARLRSLAVGGQILCSGATAELVIDSLPDDVVLADLGLRHLKNLVRPEHVFELRLETTERPEETAEAPIERPSLPAILTGPGPFVGRSHELERLMSVWQTALTGGMHAVLIAGEPGVGKTRLAGEWSQQAYQQGAVVLYGRCDEDLGAPYQPFAESLRSLVPCIGAKRLRGLRGVEALLALVPGLTDVLPDLAAPTRADPDTERYALFDAVVAVLEIVSASAPVVLILDDLHWAAKPTLLLLRHLLRFGDQARVQIVGTYRSTDLDRSHPLAAMLADLHRDGTASRLALSGLDEGDITTYVTEAGYDDEELARALASVTGGNPFFLIEALRHVDESGGVWDPSTLPQGVRETVSRRLSRLSAETNKALAAAAVVGSRFDLDLVERVVEQDLVDEFDEACKAGIVIEEAGGQYRFNHAIVRQSLLAELASVRRMRLHQRIAATLETQPGTDDELLAELAHHYFECAWAGNAVKAVDYCRRAADQAMARLGYEGAAELYDRALHALEELDDELPDRDDQAAELLIARCEALLAASDVASAAGAVSQLQAATVDSARLAAWATCFDGELSMLTHPERLDEVEVALDAAAEKLAGLDDAAGEAKAHTVRATCLARLGRIADCEVALDEALTAARRAREHRRVNAVLAGAPLAALWGPNPVPRAGGRCLDVVRLLRITTDSPAVEATSTRCQAVLEAFRGRGAAARRMIDSARRTLTELGLRHALLEVEQFAGIVELVGDDPAAAGPHLRKAYNGFRRMGLDADTAETAALLGRTCLALNRDAEADELCTESERLAGHALKPSIAWRTLRARLLSRGNDHEGARQAAEAAVSLAERTDALVDHGDACLTLATVLGAAGDVAEARVAAERAADLYERKGAAALAERARGLLGEREVRAAPTRPAPPDAPVVELDNACVRVGQRLIAAIHSEAWDVVEELYASDGLVESRRKIVGFKQVGSADWAHQIRRAAEAGGMRFDQVGIAVRGEHLALVRLEVGSADVSPGAPRDEFLALAGIDEGGRIALQVWFDVDDMDAAIAELDAAHAWFEEEQQEAPRLQNAASRLYERFKECYAARDWRTITELLADNMLSDDRRRVVNSGLRQGPDAMVAELLGMAEAGIELTSDVIAIRGEHLVLSRIRASHDAFDTVALNVLELEADEQCVARIVFEPDDFDAAIAELDARYLAGEGAAHARTWSAVAGSYTALNRREPPLTTPDCVNIDHRLETAFGPGDLIAYVRAGWDIDPGINVYVEEVHRLNSLGAVITYVAHETSQEGLKAEWRGIAVFTVEDEMINRTEVFDEADLDTALARFDQLSRPAPRLENTATRVWERLFAYIAADDWQAVAQISAENVFVDDRRRVVNAGILHGRDANIKDARATVDVGFTMTMVGALATRGGRLALIRVRVSGRDPEAVQNDALSLAEIDAEGRIAAVVVFDLDDFEAAIAELDTRYLAGEAAAYSRPWSVITDSYAAFNRHELLAADWVTIDHRGATPFEPSNFTPAIRKIWDLTPDLSIHIEEVHRLNNSGAVMTHEGHGTSQEGFDAEWRAIDILMVEDDRITRCEVFDEADLDAALARFEQLFRPAPRLENAASQAYGRFRRYFAARDWAAMADLLTADTSVDDHRRVVNAEIRRGRDIEIANMQAFADIGAKRSTATVVASRGERLVLCRTCVSGEDQQPGAFHIEFLNVVEITADDRIAARSAFDLTDFDAAIAELDARYLAGEAAAHAHTWSVIAAGYAAMNRHEVPPSAPDYVNIDHRLRATFKAGDLAKNLRAAWDLTPELKGYVEVVHRLSDSGAVVTHAAQGTSEKGFDAEWRGVHLLTLDDDMVNLCEMFDEADLDAALARFEELSQRTSKLKHAVVERFVAHLAARDWDAMAQDFAEDYYCDDRRRVVNAGLRQGRDVAIEDLRVAADMGFLDNSTIGIIATRGERCILTRFRASGPDHDAIQHDVLHVYEYDADERIAVAVVFDADDIDAAYAELDARYLAGEGAAYSQKWSAIMQACAALNRHEVFATTADFVDIDHRPLAAIGSGDLTAYIREALSDGTYNVYVEAVHRLSDLGAVVTLVSSGTSQAGFVGEWRMADIFAVDGGLISRCEIFDEADLDAALARFDELQPQARRPENAASRVIERFQPCFAARDWDALAELIVEDFSSDDRRRVVSAGLRHGRDAEIENNRAIADLGITKITSTVIATRGELLVLTRTRYSGGDEGSEGFLTEVLSVVEINADQRFVAVVAFEPDDFDAAIAELDARYFAGEAAAHADTWSVIAGVQAAVNRGDLPPMTPNPGYIDHRPLVSIEGADLAASIRAIFEIHAAYSVYVEAVHRLDELGAVYTQVHNGTSHDGVDAEWRMIEVQTVEAERVSRAEVFDEADLDVAIARFEELHPHAPRLENAASIVVARFWTHFEARDWDAMAEILANDVCTHDRRRVVNADILRGRAGHITNMRAVAEVGFEGLTSTVIATREHRLVLIRVRSSVRGSTPGEVSAEMLSIVEIDTDNRLAAAVIFDANDINAAFEELDARYLAGEASAQSRTWSAVMQAQAAWNRHEVHPHTEDWVNFDHRRGRAHAPGELVPFLRATWDVVPDVKLRHEAVHRLTKLGVVVTVIATGTSQEGFQAEWREIGLLTFEGDRINRCELFDEADLGAALARFDELDRPAPLLENVATRARARVADAINLRDANGLLALTTADARYEDRRKGLRDEGTARPEVVRAIFDVTPRGWLLEVAPIAIRGSRLALTRDTTSDTEHADRPITAEHLMVTEVNANGLVRNSVLFDPEDIDAAFEELDARYLAGEAAAYQHTWSVITRAFDAVNRRELPAVTPDCVSIDHRRGTAFSSDDLTAAIRASFDLTPRLSIRLVAVHQLNDLGAVVANIAHGTSQEGFDAEWRLVQLLTFDGERINRHEVFDEADLDAALARFDELDRPPPTKS